MFRPRVIPILLLKGNTLSKSIGFKNHKYIGDPINAVKIFNDLKADELAFLDITATKENRCVSLDFVKKLAEETNMPFAVGGGIKTLEQIQAIIGAGAEKVIVNSYAAERPEFIREASETFGKSTIVVCMDVKKKTFGGLRTWTQAGKKASKYSPLEFAQLMDEKGAGELIVQSIERDGTMEGYDLKLIEEIAKAVSIPVVALGGAGEISDLVDGYSKSYASALGAGSLFVYQSKKRGVLINYPERSELKEMFAKN